MNKVLETIYDELLEREVPNEIEDTAIRIKLDNFVDAYFSKLSIEEQFTAYEKLTDLKNESQKKAFSTGFYTAVELLTRGEH